MRNDLLNIFHILVKYEYEAHDILRKLKSVKDFSDFARKYSICSSASSGGLLGRYKTGRFVESFEIACENLDLDEISKPIKTKFGWHLIFKTIV